MKAFNQTATDFQRTQRADMDRPFIMRRRSFNEQGVKINREDFARKDKLDVIVHIDEKRDSLTRFEEVDEKKPSDGGKSIALPST